MSDATPPRIHAPRRTVKSAACVPEDYELEEGEIYDFKSIVKSPYRIPLPLSPGETPPSPPSPKDSTDAAEVAAAANFVEELTPKLREIEEKQEQQEEELKYKKPQTICCGCSRRRSSGSWIAYLVSFF